MDRSEPVRGYAGAVMAVPAERITSVHRFDDGNQHDVYRVSYLDAGGAAHAVVVRVSHTADPAEVAQAEREARVLALVGGRAAPVLHDFRVTSEWFATPAMCMQHIAGRHRPLRSVPPAGIERLGSTIGRVHALPAVDLDGGGSVAAYAEQRLRSILATLRWARDPLPAAAQADLRRAADAVAGGLDARLATDEPVALLHGDVAGGNVLWDPDPVLVDWEYARLGDPADEIAYTFDQNGLADEPRAAFWRGYESVAGTQQLARLVESVAWWEPVTLLGSSLWWAERLVRRMEADAGERSDPGVPRDAGYYGEQLDERRRRLTAMLR